MDILNLLESRNDVSLEVDARICNMNDTSEDRIDNCSFLDCPAM